MAARTHKGFFTKVQQAREALRDKADKILEEYLDVAVQAKANGDYETAMKTLQWLLEHMPADEEGQSLVDTSVDKQKQIAEKSQGPAVQIGIAIGGIGGAQKALPTVTVEPINDK